MNEVTKGSLHVGVAYAAAVCAFFLAFLVNVGFLRWHALEPAALLSAPVAVLIGAISYGMLGRKSLTSGLFVALVVSFAISYLISDHFIVAMLEV